MQEYFRSQWRLRKYILQKLVHTNDANVVRSRSYENFLHENLSYEVSLHENFQIYGIFIVVQEECIVRFKELCTIVKNKKEAQTEH